MLVMTNLKMSYMSSCGLSTEQINEYHARIVSSFIFLIAFIGLRYSFLIVFLFLDFLVRMLNKKQFSALYQIAKPIALLIPKKMINAGPNEFAVKMATCVCFFGLIAFLANRILLLDIIFIALLINTFIFTATGFCSACHIKGVINKFISF